eukprot:506179-Rhodomonas_salina.1
MIVGGGPICICPGCITGGPGGGIVTMGPWTGGRWVTRMMGACGGGPTIIGGRWMTRGGGAYCCCGANSNCCG